MPENISISVNGQSQVPPGFRFHPTEEELLQYYLRKKVSYEKIDLDVIREVDLNKLEPWDIQETCKIGSTPQNEWYLFSHKDKKYPTGPRTNRATTVGFWKATGRDKVIYSNEKRIGTRKTLVFYTGRAPHGRKSDWIMHQYSLDNNNLTTNALIVSNNNDIGDAVQEEGWVVCRIFKKKNLLKSPLPLASSVDGRDDGDLEQMGSTGYTDNVNGGRSKMGFDNKDYEYTCSKLPSLESPKSISMGASTVIGGGSGSGLTNWVTLDRLVASQLNGHSDEASRELGCLFYEEHDLQSPTFRSSTTTRSDGKDGTYIIPTHTEDHTSDIDLIWSFTPSAPAFYMSTSESLCHMSNTSL